jgi:hypothetical protein
VLATKVLKEVKVGAKEVKVVAKEAEVVTQEVEVYPYRMKTKITNVQMMTSSGS